MKPGICRRAIYAGAKLKAGPDPSSMPIKNRPEPAAPSTRAQALLSLGARRDGLGAGQIGAGLTAGKRSPGHLNNEQSRGRQKRICNCARARLIHEQVFFALSDQERTIRE